MGKNHTSIIIAVITGIFLSGNAVFAQDRSINIETAANLSIENSYDIKSQDYSVQSAENACDQAKDAADNANSTLLMNEQMRDLMEKPDKTPEEEAIVANYVPLTDDQIYQLIKIRDVQPLEAEYNLSAAKNNADSVKNSVTLNTYTQYISLLSGQDSITTEKQNIKRLSDLYNVSKLKLEVGVISQSDYKKMAASYSNETPVLSQKQRAMTIDQMNLNKLMGQDIHTTYSSFSPDLPDTISDIKTLDYYISSAMDNRAEIVNAKNYIDVKQKAYDIAKDRYPAEDNLYNKQAEYDLEEAESNFELQKTNIQKEISSEYSALLSKKKNLDNETQVYNSAKKNYNTASTKYKLGVMSKIDFESSELDYKKESDKLSSLQRELWLEQFKMEELYL